MRKLISYLFISVDGVVEAPNRFLREDHYPDLDPLDATLDEQDAVLLGRRTYDEWSAFWPDAKIEPFASFINTTPKFIVSRSRHPLGWSNSTLLNGDFHNAIAALKSGPGKAVGVHGSISLVQDLLAAGLIDELKLVLCPAAVGQGRSLFIRDGEPIQLDLVASHSTTNGLHFLTFRPRRQ
ncbi:MAG: dihydrofolate reductase family protein [Parvularculaceae bacterium]|nr:dihydrofolate reductase family protein [Parvularculaceae bacterium]